MKLVEEAKMLGVSELKSEEEREEKESFCMGNRE